MQHVLAALQ